jgi:hypothetical protein
MTANQKTLVMGSVIVVVGLGFGAYQRQLLTRNAVRLTEFQQAMRLAEERESRLRRDRDDLMSEVNDRRARIALESAATSMPQAQMAPATIPVSRPEPSAAPMMQYIGNFEPQQFFAAQGLAPNIELANAALHVVGTARRFEGYLDSHAAIQFLLLRLEAAAKAFARDDTTDPEELAKRRDAFKGALEGSTKLGVAIAARANEPATSVAQSQQLVDLLNVIQKRRSAQ